MSKYRRSKNRLWWMWGLLVTIVIIMISSFLPWRFIMMPSPSYDCSALPANELFDAAYPGRTSSVGQSQTFMTTGDRRDPDLRMDEVMNALRSYGGQAGKKLGNWIYLNPMNISFYNGLVRGQAMATVMGPDDPEPELAVGLTFMAKGDNAELALLWGHEVVHYVDFTTHADLDVGLCEEMRAYAWETLLYAEFREAGYRHPTYESELELLEKLGWQWQSQEWADYIKDFITY